MSLFLVLDSLKKTRQWSLTPPPVLNQRLVTVERGTTDSRVSGQGMRQAIGTMAKDLALAKQELYKGLQELRLDLQQRVTSSQFFKLAQQVQQNVVGINQVLTSVNGLAAEVSKVDQTHQQKDQNTAIRLSTVESNDIVVRQMINEHLQYSRTMAGALDGSLRITIPADMEVSAAELNVAGAGTFTREFIAALMLEDQDVLHLWANFIPVLTPGVTAQDEDIEAPTIKWKDHLDVTPQFLGGSVTLLVIFDTGAGKTYEIDDEVTVDIQVAVDDKWLGHAVTKKTLTFTVVA